MIFSGNTQVYIYTGSVDMRNSIDGLSAKVQGLMGKNPFTGDLFVFSNRYHNMIKVLYWHTNGFCLWMKRLEKGRFKWSKPTADMFCVHLCCMAHARRKFNDALKALDKCNLEKEEIRTSIANQAINMIVKLYAVEKEIRTREDDGNPMTSDEIFNIRQEKSKPVLLEIKDRLKYWKQIVTPRSKTGEAVNYFLNQYEQLSRYISDGRLPIDNNIVENNIRPFTLGRKNWLFNDTADGAEASAIMFSVIRLVRSQ